MSQRFVFLSILLFSYAMSIGQVLSPKDSIRINALYNTARSAEPQLAIRYFDTIISFSQQRQYVRGQILGNRQMGQAYARLQQPGKAKVCMAKALSIAEKSKQDAELIDLLLFSSAFNNEYAHYTVAFSDVTRAINISTKIKDTTLIGRSYTQLGRCYFAKKDYKKAAAYTKKGVALFTKINNIPDLRKALTSLGVINIDAAAYTQALGCFLEVEKSAPNIPIDFYQKPQLYGNIGYCYEMMGKYPLAIEYYLKTLKITSSVHPDMLVTEVVVKDNIGNLYMKIAQYKLAENYLDEALEGALQVGTPDEFKSIYQHLGDLAYAQKDFKKAFEYQEKHLVYADSVMDQEKMVALENLSVKYQTQEVEDKNQLLERENALQKAYSEQEKAHKNLILYSSIAIVIFLIGGIAFGYYYFRQQGIRTANKNRELKQKLLVSQMNPHFIFNSIDNIQSLICNKQDQDAVNYLGKFSKLTRQILENSNENYITLSEELEMTENYLIIQQLLYSNKFDFKITVDKNIDTDAILLPPMLTQPFIENAIKHGLGNKTEPGMIQISFYHKGAALFFEVSDNGNGFSTEKKETGHKSLAMAITKERLVSYTKNQDFVVHADNIIGANQTVTGAKVTFEIPYIYEN